MEDLPIEIYIRILEELDHRSLSRCSQVCKTFRTTIQESASLQLRIELDTSGQILQDHISSSDALDVLKRHHEAWRTCTWNREITIPMERAGLWELYGGVLAQNTPEGTIRFTRLPSDIRGITEKTWSVGPNFGIIIRDFGMDPSQDLLVLIESPKPSEAEPCFHLHLCSMTGGGIHRLTKEIPILSLPQDRQDPSVSYAIQASGNYIGFLTTPRHSGENQFAIWNWKTGKLELHLCSDDIRSFSFLSDERIILGGLTEAGEPGLFVVNFRKESPERHGVRELEYVDIFLFEQFYNEDVSFHHLEIRGDPGPMWEPSVDVKVPFSQDMRNQLYVVSHWIQQGLAIQCLVYFIPANAFRSVIGDKEREVHVYSSHEWEEWGPKNVRLTRSPILLSGTWVCYVYGQKYVMLDRTSTDGFSGVLLDFNQEDIGLPEMEDKGEWIKGCKTEASHFEGGDIFLRDVSTSLPYHYSRISVEDIHGHCHPMISEDSIVLVDAHCGEYRVLVF